MCSYCRDKRTAATPTETNEPRPFSGGPVMADYHTATYSTNGLDELYSKERITVDRVVDAEDLKEMTDEDIAEFVSEAAEETAERMKKTRDEMNASEARQAYAEEISNAFRYHPATPATGPKHEQVREACKMLGFRLIDLSPASDELDVALTRLREVMFWANAAVALG